MSTQDSCYNLIFPLGGLTIGVEELLPVMLVVRLNATLATHYY